MATRETRLRAATLLGALAGAAGLLVACGAVLGIDAIDYEGATEGGATGADAAGADASTSTLPDGAPIEAFAGDQGVVAADAPAGDAGRADGPFTLAQGLGVPQALAVDDTRLYWVDTQGAVGSVQSLAKDGRGSIVTLASNQPSPLDLAVDGTNVYWSVNQALPAAGKTQCLAMRATLDGGAPACATAGAFGSIRMTVSGSYILVLAQQGTNDFIGYAAADGGYQNVQAPGPALALSATSQDVYVGNKNGYHVDQLTIAALGVGPILCSDDCGNSPIVDMTVDLGQGNLLWITQAAGVYTIPVGATGMVGTQIAQLPSAPRRMARDASYVYVTAASSVFAVPLSTIATSPDASASTLTLASGEAVPFGIAVDAQYVYWTDDNGTIRAVTVPAPP